MNGRRGTGEVEYPVHVHQQRLAHVVLYKPEAGLVPEVGDVLQPAGEEVVQANHLVPALHQPLAEMGSDEPGTAGNQDLHVWLRSL